MLRKDLHEKNRLSWNAAMPAQNSHKRDQAAFLRAGGSTLFPEERELLGNIDGLSLVHLLCNDGETTLSCAQLGATVTGVDISDAAIEIARRLAKETHIAATFHCMDVFDWFEQATRESQYFDRVFCSIGVLNYLSDLALWMRGVASILRPGGRLVVVDFHPLLWTLDAQAQLSFPYFRDADYYGGKWGVGDYVGDAEGALSPSGYAVGARDFQNPLPSHDFRWNLSEILTGVLDAGLALTVLREYPYLNGAKPFPTARALPGRRWTMPEGLPSLPLMYGLAASKQGA
ncbi:MAG TPA: methyltransferase domain-containing protein [Chloroflexota bacterium]|nr:methyltransferase domain-containing protein [Chloroflexota bacterium]